MQYAEYTIFYKGYNNIVDTVRLFEIISDPITFLPDCCDAPILIFKIFAFRNVFEFHATLNSAKKFRFLHSFG